MKYIVFIILILVIIFITDSHAEESRATKIIDLVMESSDKNTSSLKEITKDYITLMREKYPHWSEQQLKKMKEAFENSHLENVTATYVEEEEEKKDSLATEVVAPIHKAKIFYLPVKATISDKHNALIAELKEESEITIISLIVKEGDTLSAIAKQNYNDVNMYIAIYDENKKLLSSPHVIPIGITLKVPKISPHMKEKYSNMLKKYEEKEKKRKTMRVIKRKSIERKEKEKKQLQKEKNNSPLDTSISNYNLMKEANEELLKIK
jgi:phage tail protein X